MCGLLLAPNSYSDAQISASLQSMAYRGDGEEGHLSIGRHGGWAVGHVRLAIQNREGGAQPFAGGAGTMTAFVGEFFSHYGKGEQALVAELMKNEMLFHHQDGFWAIIHTTGANARVYTDHLGIKPMYYWPSLNIVCSEIEPMFALTGTRPPLDEIYLSNCIKFGYDYSGRTPYQGIYQMAPGSCLELNGLRKPISRIYWLWSQVPIPYALRSAVDTAIRNRLIGERPMALLLSGGLDSSIIYYTLKEWGAPIEAFSIENGESEFLPEGVTTLPLPKVDIFEALSVMKAPLDLGSMVPQVQLARAVAKAGYHVCLTGDGADEVFGGYRRAKEYDSQHSDVFCELPYYHLPRLDRVMMASTIELRSPFLSPAVVASGLRLPHGFRTEKQALKHAYASLVPEEIINRPKHPLKTTAVIEGGVDYRRQLVTGFRDLYANP